MNAGIGGYGYAQARIQARLGRRTATEDLQRARAARDPAAYLQQLRATSLAPHVARLTADMDVHEVERRLREDWAATVEEVARWLPVAWRPALRWMRWLPWLPALQKLARGGRAAAWTREDPVLARIIAAEPARRARVLGGTALAPLQAAVAAHGDVAAAWRDHWRTLWPDAPAAARPLGRLAAEVTAAASGLGEDTPRGSSEERLRRVRARLVRGLRRHPLSPVAACAFLGLEGLDLLEVRGAVTMRVALAGTA